MEVSFVPELLIRSSLCLIPALLLSRVLGRVQPAFLATLWTLTFSALCLLPGAIVWMPDQLLPLPVESSSVALVEPDLSLPAAMAVSPRVLSGPVAQDWNWIWLWALGVGFCLLRWTWVYWQAGRWLGSAKDLDCPRLLKIFEQEVDSFHLPRRPVIQRCAQLAGPAACGFLRPRVLLPEGVESWSERRFRWVLRHELSHLQRRDPLRQLVGRLACGFCWPNPLVWWANRRFTHERERACDEQVLATGVKPADYASELLALCQGHKTSPAVVAMARRSGLERRLVSILERHKSGFVAERKTRGLAPILTAGLMLLLVVSPVVGEGQASNRDTPQLPKTAPKWSERVQPLEPTGPQSAIQVDEVAGSRVMDVPLGVIGDGQVRTVLRTLEHQPAKQLARRLVELGHGGDWNSIRVDEGTNSLVIRESDNRLGRVLAAIERLDTPSGLGLDVAPLRTVMRSLEWRSAEELALRLAAMGIPGVRGSVQVDDRTNTVIIRDAADRLDRVLAEIDRWDVAPDSP